MTYFTSDQHFGHFNIIRLSHRPFASLDEMNVCSTRVLTSTDLRLSPLMRCSPTMQNSGAAMPIQPEATHWSFSARRHEA